MRPKKWAAEATVTTRLGRSGVLWQGLQGAAGGEVCQRERGLHAGLEGGRPVGPCVFDRMRAR